MGTTAEALIGAFIVAVVGGLFLWGITTGRLFRFPGNTWRRIVFRCARQNRIRLHIQGSKKTPEADTARVDLFYTWVRPDDYISMEMDYERYDCLTFECFGPRPYRSGGRFVVFEENVGIPNISFPYGPPTSRPFVNTFHYGRRWEVSVVRFGNGSTLSFRFAAPRRQRNPV